jgi:phenylpropionate dioxygenase-like ring-hydroxylating dioxygenase large terminal subunit
MTELSPVLAPLSQARGLPNAHYTDPGVFAEERDSVLFASWAGVGFGKDIPNVGDAKPVDFLGMPLLLVRDEDEEIQVYQNTCRHRGMILVEEPQTIRGAIRCPYHSWCYTLKGRLRTTPHVGGPGKNTHEAVDRDELGLFKIRNHVWMDVIFVNVDGQAQDFDKTHADLLERWAEFDRPLYHGGASSSFQLEVNTNWKLAVENYCESYHLPWVHPGLNSYSRLEDHYHIEAPGKYSGQGTFVYRQLTGENDEVFADFEGLSDKWDTGAEYVALYPNVLLGVHRDHVFTLVLQPKDVDRTTEHVSIYYATSSSDVSNDLATRNAAQWKEVFTEDVGVVEGMQRGRRGRFFDGGRFSPAMDGPTHLFHQWIAERVQEKRAL